MRALRDKDPNAFRLITIRTTEAKLWLGLSANVRKLIGGIIARYQEILGTEIFAYCALGNHIHLLIRSLRENTDEFCENVNREIARRINWKLRREGALWGRRYADHRVLSEEDLLEAFIYINTNPTRHGLISDSGLWPGLNSFEQVISETDRSFSFYHYSKPEAERVTHHKLKISVLPQFAGLTKKERAAKVRELLSRRLQDLADGKHFPRIDDLVNQMPGGMPSYVSRSPQPACYSKCPVRIREFRVAERARRSQFAEASCRYRLGLPADFPPYTFRPPLHRLPRSSAFVNATISDLIP